MSTAAAEPVLGAALNANDRCDRCGARAHMIALKPNSQPLLFCLHHSVIHSPALRLAGWRLA